MKVYMQVYGIWEAIEPKNTKDAIEDKIDKMDLAVIYQRIPEDMLLSVVEKRTSKEAWEAVKTLCLGADRVKKARIQMIKAEFEFLKMKDSELIDDICMRLNGLITSIIEQFGDLELMTIEEAVGSLKAHEERLCGQSESSVGGQLLLTEEEWRK
ncbi:hypothetical protein AgCh_023641 [Apium graveolens]